jgi:hypothetical protein
VDASTRTTGWTRLPFIALLLYVTLDFANPLMAGAVCFDPDRSVEAVGRARSPVPAATILTGPAVLPAPPVDEPDPGLRLAPAPERARTTSGLRPRARATLGASTEPSPEDG